MIKPWFQYSNIKFIEPGEYVEADEIVAVIETDKVNVDIRSPQSGTIKQYFASEGDTVAVDANFFEIDPEAKGSAKQDAAPQSAPKKVSTILRY